MDSALTLDPAMSLAGSVAAAAGSTYVNAEAATLVARRSTPPSAGKKTAIDAFFTAIKAGATSGSNILAKLDLLYVFDADEQASLLNWAQAAYDATKVGTVSFGARGATPDGSTGYLTTGFAPGVTGGSKGSQNSQHLGFVAASSFYNEGVALGGVVCFLQPRTGNNLASRVHQGTSATVAVTNSHGVSIVNRTGASLVRRYKNGSAAADDTNASQSPSNSPLLVFARNTSTTGTVTPGLYFSQRTFAVFAGSGLTDAESLDLSNALLALQTAYTIGVAWDFDDIRSNLTRWFSLRAEHAGARLLNTGLVETLNDMSDAAAAYTQATSAKRPTYDATGFNSKPCMTGDGVADIALVGSLWTGAVVITIASTDRLQVSPDAVAIVTPSAAPSVPHVASCIWTPAGAVLRINGVQVASDATSRSTSGAVVMAIDIDGAGGGGAGRVADSVSGAGVLMNRPTATGRQWQGKFAEVAYLDATAGILANVERAEGKLAHEWWGAGVLNTLDSGHTYKSTAPVR